MDGFDTPVLIGQDWSSCRFEVNISRARKYPLDGPIYFGSWLLPNDTIPISCDSVLLAIGSTKRGPERMA